MQLGECLDFHVGVDVALPNPDPGHHVHALLLVLGEGDVVPPQLPVPCRCGYINPMEPSTGVYQDPDDGLDGQSLCPGL